MSSLSHTNSNGKPTVLFTIGSLEYFEDEMNKVQERLSIPISERLPIVYEEKVHG